MARIPPDHEFDSHGKCIHCGYVRTSTITLPLADVAALVKLAWEQTRHIEAIDRSATGSIYGIEYADKTIAKVAVKLPA